MLLGILSLNCSASTDSITWSYSGDWIDKPYKGQDSIVRKPIPCTAVVDETGSYFKATVTNDSTKEIITILGPYVNANDSVDYFEATHYSNISSADSTDSDIQYVVMRKDRSAFSFVFAREKYTRSVSLFLKKN
jgi:hypothetical protein